MEINKLNKEKSTKNQRDKEERKYKNCIAKVKVFIGLQQGQSQVQVPVA